MSEEDAKHSDKKRPLPFSLPRMIAASLVMGGVYLAVSYAAAAPFFTKPEDIMLAALLAMLIGNSALLLLMRRKNHAFVRMVLLTQIRILQSPLPLKKFLIKWTMEIICAVIACSVAAGMLFLLSQLAAL